MEGLKKYANKLKSEYPDLTEDIDNILIILEDELEDDDIFKERMIQSAYIEIDELL